MPARVWRAPNMAWVATIINQESITQAPVRTKPNLAPSHVLHFSRLDIHRLCCSNGRDRLALLPEARHLLARQRRLIPMQSRCRHGLDVSFVLLRALLLCQLWSLPRPLGWCHGGRRNHRQAQLLERRGRVFHTRRWVRYRAGARWERLRTRPGLARRMALCAS